MWRVVRVCAKSVTRQAQGRDIEQTLLQGLPLPLKQRERTNTLEDPKWSVGIKVGVGCATVRRVIVCLAPPFRQSLWAEVAFSFSV